MTADRAVLREQAELRLGMKVEHAVEAVLESRGALALGLASALVDAVMPFVSDALAAVEAERDSARAEGYVAGVEAAQEELVKRDQFSSRTLEILDDLIAAYRKEHPDA